MSDSFSSGMLLSGSTLLQTSLETPLHYFNQCSSGLNQARSEIDKLSLVVTESALCGHLILRGDGEDSSFVATVSRILEVPLPVTPCTCSENGKIRIYWLGPDEWLLLDYEQTATMEKQLRESLSGHIAVVDVSGGQTMINLRGRGVETVLQKSSGYDFHPKHFTVGRCVQTNFAKATAIVSKRDDNSFDMVIRRSFADYIASWLLDAGREFGCRIELAVSSGDS